MSLELLTAVSTAASAVFLFGTMWHLGGIGKALVKISRTLSEYDDCCGPPLWLGLMGSPAGYAIYVFRQGQWVMDADLSRTGFEASPPTMPGTYEGQVIKRESKRVP